MSTVWYDPQFLVVLALNLGQPDTANRIWMGIHFPTLSRYART